MLCSVCESLFAPGNVEITTSKTLSYSPRFHHHSNGHALKSAALGGCPLCLRVWKNFSEEQRELLCGVASDSTLELPPVTGQIQRFVRDGCYKFDFRCGSVKWHFVTSPSTEAGDKDNEGASWRELNTSAESVMAQAEHWLRTCLEQHDCGKQTQQLEFEQRWYPTRLIDVGTSNEPILRLILSKKISASSPYMTLSHCWGYMPIFKLLKSNLDLLSSSIKWGPLTLTFRNAITVARRLGIRYLWIDSLCIIQDSPADWLHEGTLMGKVYKHSHCNIAATGVPNGQHGFFITRDPSVIRPLKVCFPPDVQEAKTAMRKLNRIQRAQSNWTYVEWHEIVDLDMWTKSIDHAPLNRRAWVAQEHILSPRNLHFTSTQLFFECRCLAASETHPRGIPDILSSSRLTKSLSTFLVSSPLAPENIESTIDSFPTTLHLSSGSTNPFHVWDAVLLLYSAGKLTYASDKLVAISGIARELAPKIGGRYLAGLWEVQMARQMLWIAAPEEDPDNSSTDSQQVSQRTWRAPSWSWASTDAPLKMAMQWDYRGVKNKRDWLVDVLSADVVPVEGGDEFGQVESAEVRIRGRMISIRLISGGSEREEGERRYKIALDRRVLEGVTVFEDREVEDVKAEKFCVPVSVSVSTPRVSLDRRTLVYGLLVERVEGGGRYRRIGVFMAPKGEEFLVDRGLSDTKRETMVKTFDWRNCAQWHGERGRTFGEDILVLI